VTVGREGDLAASSRFPVIWFDPQYKVGQRREAEMGYRNKTYVIFDGDNDMWAYRFMRGWKANERVDFDFFDAHDLQPLTDRASEETVKRTLRGRLSNTKQAILLIGEQTKTLYRFVRWEIDTCLDLEIPIIAVNLNGKRTIDRNLCPPILREELVVHVSFKLAIIRHALDRFPQTYEDSDPDDDGPLHYKSALYDRLEL
jgi:hypothetical protein